MSKWQIQITVDIVANDQLQAKWLGIPSRTMKGIDCEDLGLY